MSLTPYLLTPFQRQPKVVGMGTHAHTPKSDEDVAEAIGRMIRALGSRCAESDPDTGVYLRMIGSELRAAESRAVAGWRRSGFSDRDIGRELGVTKQAVAKRWPRELTAA